MMRTGGVLIVACVADVAPAFAQAPAPPDTVDDPRAPAPADTVYDPNAPPPQPAPSPAPVPYTPPPAPVPYTPPPAPVPYTPPPAPYPYAPAPYPYAPPKPVKPPDDGPPEPRYRSVLGVGISGTLKPDWDQRFTLATELERNIRTSDRFSIGWNVHWSFRNWGVVKAVYSQIDETTDNKSKVFGYALGWISGTSMLGGGWQVKYASTAEAKGWALVGTRLVLFLDPTESEEGDEVDASWSHALHGGVGYDFGKAGFGLRAMWAPDAALFGSTDSAPLLLVMGTIEVLKD